MGDNRVYRRLFTWSDLLRKTPLPLYFRKKQIYRYTAYNIYFNLNHYWKIPLPNKTFVFYFI